MPSPVGASRSVLAASLDVSKERNHPTGKPWALPGVTGLRGWGPGGVNAWHLTRWVDPCSRTIRTLIRLLTKSRSRREGQGNVGQGNEYKGAGTLARSRFPSQHSSAPQSLPLMDGRRNGLVQRRREIPPRLCVSARHSVSCWRAGNEYKFTPLADAYAHARLARSPPPYRQWPRVPRTVQVLFGAGGRAFLHGLPVRRAERVTSESCPWCGALAWGQSASLETTVRRRERRC